MPKVQAGGLEQKMTRRKRNPLQLQAQYLSDLALKTGTLPYVRYCEQCHAPFPEKHHPNYAEPLKVVWLCHRCHLRTHHDLRYPERTISKQLMIPPSLYAILANQSRVRGITMNAWMLRLLEFGAKREEDGK